MQVKDEQAKHKYLLDKNKTKNRIFSNWTSRKFLRILWSNSDIVSW